MPRLKPIPKPKWLRCLVAVIAAVVVLGGSLLPARGQTAVPVTSIGAAVTTPTPASPGDDSAAATAQQVATIGRTTSQVRLRGTADQDGPILLLIPTEAEIVLLGRAENGFYPAAWSTIAGWVETGAIESPAAPPARGTEAIRALLDSQEALADAQVNIRAEPDPDADLVAMLHRHEPAKLTGRVSGGYLEVMKDGEAGWIEGRFLSAPGAGNAPREYKREEIIAIIYEAADYYGQPRADMLRVARCESDLTPTAIDPVGGAYGLFQFKPFTWDDTPYAEYDIFDPRANAFAAAWMWSVGNKDAWVCQ